MTTVTIPADHGPIIIEHQGTSGRIVGAPIRCSKDEDAIQSLLLALVLEGVITAENAAATGRAVDTALEAVDNNS